MTRLSGCTSVLPFIGILSFMSFQRAPISIVRSIRHVSLVKGWARARPAPELPQFSSFVPDERAGDSADTLIAELKRTGDIVTFNCQSAGERVEKIFGRRMQGRQIRDSVESHLVVASRPIWAACISQGLPVYSVLPVVDRDGRPVTIEQIYLPYRLEAQQVEIIVAAFHAWSVEGRFALDGLMLKISEPTTFPFSVIDPALRLQNDDDSTLESV